MRSFLQQRSWVCTAFAIIGLIVMVVFRWSELTESDGYAPWAEVSGWFLLILGFWLAGGFHTKFRSMVERLFRRELISDLSQSSDEFLSSMETLAKRLARIGAIVFPLVILLSYLLIDRFDKLEGLKISLEVIAASLVGLYAGEFVAYGFLGLKLKRRGARIRTKIGHPDGAGGLRIVGGFYLYQAGLVMIPLSFFAFWLTMSYAIPEAEGTMDWFYTRDPYTWHSFFVVFLFSMLAIEVFAFALPMNFFHEEMVRNAEDAGREADKTAMKILELDQELKDSIAGPGLDEIEGRRKLLVSQFHLLEAAPKWPVDSTMHKRFTASNAIIMIAPLLAKIPLVGGLIGELFGK